MSRGSEAASDRSSLAAANGRFLIRLTLAPEDQDELWELCREIEHLGGIPTPDGYSFASEHWRDEAADYLADSWGPWYFVSLNLGGRQRARRSPETAVRLVVAGSKAGPLGSLCELLAQEGFDVEPASDALQCLDMLRLHRPQLLVLQQRLLWGGGDGVLARLREDLQELSIPVVLIVDRTAPPPPVEAPLVRCLAQPVVPEDLLKVLQHELSRCGSRS